ncbi:MAG: 4Fe-4S ferredoxin [Desulfuromonadales bacterium]|nr:4Fe-4S ferredoxin [Desulfuromonadales bacterium]
MGHHLGSKSSIVPLIDRLNKNPVGLVDSEKLRQILTLLFSEEEASVASKFPLEEATIDELVRQTGLDEEALLPILDNMAEKGLVMDLPYAGTTYYMLMPGLIGFFEFTFMKNRADLPLPELARLMTEYLFEDVSQGQAKEFFGGKTSLTRSLVYDDVVPISSEVSHYENAREIISAADYGAVGMCYCRHKKEHLGESCAKHAPVEGTCISLGTAARFMVRRGFAEKKSTEELLAILDQAKDLKLTHITDNVRHKPSFVCNCCSCCCELMSGVKAGFNDGVAKTPFLAVVDIEKCNNCGLCFSACNVAAITSAQIHSNSHAVIDVAPCLGCGVCVPTCARDAISLVERDDRPMPPEKHKDMFVAILKEKGRLKPYLVSGVKKRAGRLLAKKKRQKFM